jgi:hypothetical protein
MFQWIRIFFKKKGKLSKLDQTFQKKIHNYNILLNIFDDVCNGIDFVLCMSTIYSKNLIKLYVVWLF